METLTQVFENHIRLAANCQRDDGCHTQYDVENLQRGTYFPAYVCLKREGAYDERDSGALGQV